MEYLEIGEDSWNCENIKIPEALHESTRFFVVLCANNVKNYAVFV